MHSGENFAISSDVLNDKNLLKKKIESLKPDVTILKREIEEMERDDSLETLQEIISMDDYFEQKKAELAAEINRLENEKI